jgi:hypothetical protein
LSRCEHFGVHSGTTSVRNWVCRFGMSWNLISSLGALTQRSEERGHSYLGDKNVSVWTFSDDNRFIFLSKERIAIARALLRNPKVLLLDEVILELEHVGSLLICPRYSRLHLHLIPTRRRWSRQLSTKRQKVGRRSPLHTGCQRSRTPTECKLLSCCPGVLKMTLMMLFQLFHQRGPY